MHDPSPNPADAVADLRKALAQAEAHPVADACTECGLGNEFTVHTDPNAKGHHPFTAAAQAEGVGIVAYWNDDNESWWFDTGEAGDADENADRFHGVIPAALWKAHSDAYKAWSVAGDAIQAAMGLGEDGTLDQVCPEWVGRITEARPYVNLVAHLGKGGLASYFGGHDTVADAEAMLADLPEVVYVLAWGKPTKILRSTIKIESGEHAGYETGCYRCGHIRSMHDTAAADGQ